MANSLAASPEFVSGTSERLCSLPLHRPVAMAVLEALLRCPIDVDALPELIGTDPAQAVELLVLANSAAYGCRSRVFTVTEAVGVLGLSYVQRLAAIAVSRSETEDYDQTVVERFWRHSVACGLVCAELSGDFSILPSRAYTLGLLHDIGRLGMLAAFRDGCYTTVTSAANGIGDVLRMEEKLVGMNHCTAGLWLVRAWGLPVSFVDVVGRHHEPLASLDSKPTTLVKIACGLASAAGFGVRLTGPGEKSAIQAGIEGLLGRKVDLIGYAQRVRQTLAAYSSNREGTEESELS